MYSFSNESNNINNIQVGNQQLDIYTQLQLMYQKIIKLEESNNNLSHLLNDEISQRQILEKHSTTSIDAFSGQLNILKNNYDKIEEILVENISKLKEKNNTKNDNKNIFNSNIEEIIKKEIGAYKIEINKIENLENKINGINKENKKNMKEINDKIDLINNEIKPLKDSQKKNKNNLQKLRDEFQLNLNNNQNFLNEVNNILLDFKKNMDIYNSSYNKSIEELRGLHENVNIDKNNNNKKMDEIQKRINSYINDRNKEMDNFENHLLNEYEKFINFIQTKFDELNEGVKKLVDYNGEDINIMKEKMDLFQEANKKLRIDLFKGLNETEDFFEKKYNSILKIINK
jgi:hypothetical protein